MGLRGGAAIVGVADYPSERVYTGTRQFSLEQWADLSSRALADAGIASSEVNGIVCVGDVSESAMFHPATIAEYCGWSLDFAERVDLGGASAVAAVWRAAAAIELGICDVVVVTCTGRPKPELPSASPQERARTVNASSWTWGSPQSEFEVPYGDIPPNVGFAFYASRYHAMYGNEPADHLARAKIAADQRASACMNPNAAFYGKPITPEDVLASRLIADPLHILEIVMLCHGGGSVVLASKERAQRCPKRPVFLTGCGEHLAHKTLLHDHRVAHHRAVGVLRFGCGSRARARERSVLQGLLPREHARRDARHGPTRFRRRVVDGARGDATDPRRVRRSSGAQARHGIHHRYRRHHERTSRAHRPRSMR
jgi:acetyl-CoA C-acetyltransferase